MSLVNSMLNVYNKLYNSYKEQGWWPIISKDNRVIYNKTFKNREKTQDEKLQICLGAILTQNTVWKNVEKALINLNKNKLISIKRLDKVLDKKLALLIKPSGYYNQKVKTIKNFISFVKKYRNINELFLDKKIREKLLKVKGIGPETADSMILYAGNKPIFVVDAYTKRIFTRLNKLKSQTYDELQGLLHKNMEKDSKLFNEYHALIVKHAKEHCKKIPSCENCCLKDSCKSATL